MLESSLKSKGDCIIIVPLTALLTQVKQDLSILAKKEKINVKLITHHEIKRSNNYKNIYIVANLPYYITTPIVSKFVMETIPANEIVIMIQKEVAERLSAPVGTKEYGQITVLLNYHFNIEKIIDVDRKAFYPTPNVDSAVIKMIRKDSLEDLTSFEHFDKLVKDSFQFKRKTIKNNLINKYNLDIVSKVLEKYGYDLSMRSEKIPYYVFVEISNELLK
jgi:16S rRNA (adenine1518-N6/adenine1519-N6)-dimethyltransferase